jgi:amino acid permease
MKLIDVLVLSLAVAFLIIAIHQTMVVGFQKAYWLVMVALILYFVYNLRKKSKS